MKIATHDVLLGEDLVWTTADPAVLSGAARRERAASIVTYQLSPGWRLTATHHDP